MLKQNTVFFVLGLNRRAVLPGRFSFTNGLKFMTMDGNLTQSMRHIFSNISKHIFKSALETNKFVPAEQSFATQRYSNTALGRIFRHVPDWMGVNCPNVIDWAQLFLAFATSPIFIIMCFVIVTFQLHL